jgi:hypothetical protein
MYYLHLLIWPWVGFGLIGYVPNTIYNYNYGLKLFYTISQKLTYEKNSHVKHGSPALYQLLVNSLPITVFRVTENIFTASLRNKNKVNQTIR